VFLKAFDDAWDSIAGNFGDDPQLVEAARGRLAKAILALSSSHSSVEAIKIAALEAMALAYRERSA